MNYKVEVMFTSMELVNEEDFKNNDRLADIQSLLKLHNQSYIKKTKSKEDLSDIKIAGLSACEGVST